MKQQLHVCFCHDNEYLKYATVLMNSIDLNAERKNPQKKSKYKFVFHLLCDFLSDESKSYLPQIEKALSEHFECKIIYHQVDDYLFKKYKSWDSDGKISYATYLRLLIPEILGNNVDKCVYLDCDMLCYGDLTELFEVDLEDAVIAASPDQRALMEQLEFKGKKLNKDFKHVYGENECYFNAGMLVINLKQWRKDNITSKCIDYLNKYDVAFPDQDVLNMVLFDRVKFVSLSWNFNSVIKKVLLEKIDNLKNKTESVKNLILPIINSEDPVNVYHYFGRPKPWRQEVYYFLRGQIYIIEDRFLLPYLEMAYSAPVFGEFFTKTLKINLEKQPLILLKEYSEQLEQFLTIQYNRLKKKYQKLKLFIVLILGFQIFEIIALFYLLNKIG